MLTKKQVLLTFVVGFLLVLPATATAATRLSSSEWALLNAVNGVRASNGLARLSVDPVLVRAARAHSGDMLRRNYFSHGAFSQRILATGARGPMFGENLAWGTAASPQWVISHWLASPPHRAILLRPGFRRIGIGAVRGTFSGAAGATVITADFAGW
jgi:uncharacterized protein YkwD